MKYLQIRKSIMQRPTEPRESTVNKCLQWKVASLLGYVTALMFTLVLCAEQAMPAGSLVFKMAP